VFFSSISRSYPHVLINLLHPGRVGSGDVSCIALGLVCDCEISSLSNDVTDPKVSVRICDRSPHTRVVHCDGTEMLQINGSNVAG
jgi:hypothetical protein